MLDLCTSLPTYIPTYDDDDSKLLILEEEALRQHGDEVINLLGQTLFERAKQIRDESQSAARQKLLEDAAVQFEKTLKLDQENVAAHYGLRQIHSELRAIAEKNSDPDAVGRHELAAKHHGDMHERYKPDDNARDMAQKKAKEKYPPAAKAAEPIVIYSLNRPSAPGLADAKDIR